MSRQKLLVADLFCGAGGFTTGLMRELESQGIECELVAVNHNPTAIATHSHNHPRARHVIADLMTADPERLVPEGRLDILLASPTCTFHSRARGGKPTSDQERMDPWVIVTWCTKLRVKRLILENVPEFVDWGPIDPRTGRPIKSRKGEYFRAFMAALDAIGVRVEWRILTAADYGDATTRRRFFALGRSDRKVPNWPEATHTRDGIADLFGQKKKWRAAREIINWTDRGRSIFLRKAPLKPNTLRRIMAGAVKLCGPWAEVFRVLLQMELYRSILYWEAGIRGPDVRPIATWDATGRTEWRPRKRKRKSKNKKKRKKPEIIYTGPIYDEPTPALYFRSVAGRIAREPVEASPYLVVLRGTHASQLGNARDVAAPVPAISAQGGHVGLVRPFVFQVNQSDGRHRSFRTVDHPLFTVLTRDSYGLADFAVAPFTCANRNNNVARATEEPVHAITTTRGGGLFLVQPGVFVIGQGSNAQPYPDTDPIPTVTSISRIRLVEPVVTPFVLGQQAGSVARHTREPLPTIAGGGAISLSQLIALPFLLNRHGDNGGHTRGRSVDDPCFTATRSGGGYLVEPWLAVMKRNGTYAQLDTPVPALTTHKHLAMVEPYLVTVNHGGGAGRQAPRALERPLGAITTHHGIGLVDPYLVVVNHGDDASGNCDRRVRSVDDPLLAITAKAHGGGFGVASAFLTPYYGNGQFHSVAQPVPTVTTKDRFALVVPAFIVPNFGERPTQAPRYHLLDVPLPAVTSHGAGGLVEPFILNITHSGSRGSGVRSCASPIPTLTTARGGEFALVEPFVICVRHARMDSGPRPRAVSDPLPTITANSLTGDFALAEPFVVCTRHGAQGAGPGPRSVDAPLPTITTGDPAFGVASLTAGAGSGRVVYVDGQPVLVDILFRMLRNPELAAAMSFTGDEYQYEFHGTETEITKQIGNAVPVRTARALVRSTISDLVKVTRKAAPRPGALVA